MLAHQDLEIDSVLGQQVLIGVPFLEGSSKERGSLLRLSGLFNTGVAVGNTVPFLGSGQLKGSGQI